MDHPVSQVSLCLERRRTPRAVTVAEHGVVCVRVRPGFDASLLDISAGGAAIETACRLLPGTVVTLQLETRDRRHCARGRVVRCTVVSVQASRVSYRGAVCFEAPVAASPRALREYLVPASCS
ncbi:MAG: hypothetical protein GEU82_10155 [Luteitalea sp.]|nr:hypothetical protein [Luteitalea sp.]